METSRAEMMRLGTLICVVFSLPDVMRTQTALPPECAPGGHSVLQDSYRSTNFRSSRLQQAALQDFICDHSLTPGWYQFQIFDKRASMPTQCVEVNHCGTQAPVWLSLGNGESLPAPLEVRQLTACATWQSFQSSSKDCCMFRIPVTVRNCGEFYVYLLQPTKGCMGYCAQEMPETLSSTSLICGPGEVKVGGTCKANRPPVPSVPAIVSEMIDNTVYLKCSFESSSNSSSLGHVMTWSRLSPDGKKEELKQETTIQTSSLLELDGFNLRLGDKMYCSSFSFFWEWPEVRSASVESPEFFAGVRLKPELTGITEDGRWYQMLVESSVPVPCPDGSFSSADECILSLELISSGPATLPPADEGLLDADLFLSSCVVDLSQGPCRDGICSQALVHFSPVTDFVRDNDRTSHISVKPIITQNFLWSGYSPEPVQIKVKDVPSAYCYSFTDSHVITFDGRLYENNHIGTFVLYKSSFWTFEVHIRQWECGSLVRATSCVCGFAARNGDDIISFDMCNGEMGETKPLLSVKNRDSTNSGLRITESYQGRKVTVTFPFGASIRADVSDWGMSLSLRAPGSDRNHTEGLCGTFDGQPDNDFHTAGGTELEEHQAFISEWRLPPGSSLFDSVPSHEKTPETHNYCTCRVNPPVSFPRTPSQQTSSDSSCSSFGVISFPSFIPTLDVTAEYISSMEPPTINQRQQIASDPSSKSSHGGSSHIPGSSRTMSSSTQHRQTPVHLSLSWSEQKSFSYFFPEDHKEAVQPEVSPTWPTPSSLTQEQAWGQCQQTVANSSIAVGCRLLLQESVISRAMQMCVSDLQLKDEPLWLSGTLPLLENECERKLVEEGGMKLEYQDALHILRCPNLCSGNGQCSDWGCVCFPGFGSYDCSVLMDQIPEITKLEKDGLCDIHVEDCSTIRVFGHSFMVSRTLKCEFVKEKFEDGEWLLDAPRFVPTTSLNETALECQLPLEDSRDPAGVDLAAGTNGPLARWQIKVSNDGYSFSNAKILTLYDGACQTCSLDSDVTCSLKEKTCSIDGLCYRDGESSPSSPCLTCNPALSQHTWSKTQKNRPPVFQSPRFRLRSFHEENFIHQLQAEDPEGSVVLFTLVSGPEGTSLSPDGLLRWKATAKPTDTHMFHFTVADSCGAESSASVQVFVQSCECLNGAACITDVNSHANSGEHRCACLDGFMGRRCEVEVDSCKPNPCRLGRCINRANAFTCICPPGMTGRTCRQDIDECISQPCFPTVSCKNTPGSFSVDRVLKDSGVTAKPATVMQTLQAFLWQHQ
ncbi:von Willebrand factor D and EGF domains protein [Nothobranchius furzeri]|uniref:von Willebrand factor D and EGF domains protein n=1 Tax=Nothobranchius furzeri TaxID=105023 RepID=A0A9D2YTL5_NOTFU|nr:von Willebrand factor D and EGF domains protein [Nothobranchius furzeri]